MRGVSTIIVGILLMMISVSITSLGYIFFTNIYTGVTTSSEETISKTVTIMLSGMKIESVFNITTAAPSNITVRNTGKVDLTKFSVYRNDTSVTSNGNTITIKPGDVGIINLAVQVKSGEKVEVSSAEGATAIYVKP